MTQHPSETLNAYNSEFRFPGPLTDEAAESSDGTWEDKDDIVDSQINAGLGRPSSPASASATSTRHDYAGASIPPSPSPRLKKERFTLPSVDVLLDGAKDVSSRAFHHSRFMLGFLLALWTIAFITIQVSSTLWGAVSPVCYVPFISSSNICEGWRNTLPGKKAPLTGKKTPRWADYPKMVDLQSKTFQQLMDESIGGSALSLEVKKAEMAITDLVSFVRLSKLKAKDTLASSLLQFVLDAKKTGRGLQKLSSKIGGAVDK